MKLLSPNKVRAKNSVVTLNLKLSKILKKRKRYLIVLEENFKLLNALLAVLRDSRTLIRFKRWIKIATQKTMLP